jgi:single-stranded DNA-binding protein
MALNQNNFGIVAGRLTRDVAIFDNKDGSKKALVSVAVDNNFTSRDGKRHSQFLSLEAYIPATVEGLGAFAHMAKGDAVGFEVHLEADQYTKDGQTVYTQKVVIDGVDFKETRATTQARLESRKVEEAAAAAGVAVVGGGAQVDPADSPFSA